jgi:ribosomal protein S1
MLSHINLLLLIFEIPIPTCPQLLHSAGTNIKVQIEEFSSEGKKLVLSMSFENRADVGALSGISSSKWLNGVVQSVSPFGIFVRPAGYEMTGYFVHCCMSINYVFCRNTLLYSYLS